MQKRSAKKAMKSGTSKKTRAPKKATKLVEEEEDELISYWIEPDCLECSICVMPFESQVYMCKNGHPACAKCCISMNRSCSCCSDPIGDIRCRPLEKVLAGMTSPCKFKKHGCDEFIIYNEKRSHEEACQYAPYHCPFDDCDYHDLQLYNHIESDHASGAAADDAVDGYMYLRLRGTTVMLQKGTPFRVLLHNFEKHVFLLVNGGDVLSGRSLSVVCIGPHPTEEVELEYKMEVRSDEQGALSMSASGTIPCIRRLEEFQAKGFLFVPDAYWGSSGSVSVTVSV